jgi:hypothetical protein
MLMVAFMLLVLIVAWYLVFAGKNKQQGDNLGEHP